MSRNPEHRVNLLSSDVAHQAISLELKYYHPHPHPPPQRASLILSAAWLIFAYLAMSPTLPPATQPIMSDTGENVTEPTHLAIHRRSERWTLIPTRIRGGGGRFFLFRSRKLRFVKTAAALKRLLLLLSMFTSETLRTVFH